MNVLYHLHIPKTAGTTIRNWVSSRIPEAQRFPHLVWSEVWKADEDYPSWRRRMFNTRRTRLISGHFGYQADRLFIPGSLKRFTFLREPRARCVSFYRHIQNNTETEFFVTDRNGTPIPYPRPFPGFDETLEHPVFASMFDNIQTRYLGLDYDARLIRDAYRHLPDFCPDFDHTFIGIEMTDRIFRKAKRRLRRMDFGLQEYLHASQLLLRDALNLPCPLNFKDRFMVYEKKDFSIPKRKLKEVNRWDAELYAFAKEVFFSRFVSFAARNGVPPPVSMEALEAGSVYMEQWKIFERTTDPPDGCG